LLYNNTASLSKDQDRVKIDEAYERLYKLCDKHAEVLHLLRNYYFLVDQGTNEIAGVMVLEKLLDWYQLNGLGEML
jgi:hypothetical protein